MPRLLVARFIEDSVSQFRASAKIRNEDAWELYDRGRFTAAIYLWGYAVEMILKSAWFSNVLDYDENRAIKIQDLDQARNIAKNNYGISWNNLHDIEGWAQLIVAHRIKIGCIYSDPGFYTQVGIQSQRVYLRWREILRYKKNRAYHFEANIVADSANFFLVNTYSL
ncbi:MAG: hypothetical protein ABSA26_12975 [Thermoguttaceae bacterium]